MNTACVNFSGLVKMNKQKGKCTEKREAYDLLKTNMVCVNFSGLVKMINEKENVLRKEKHMIFLKYVVY